MAAPINSDLLVAGILRSARQQGDAMSWLTQRHADALSAVMAGDEFVTSTSFHGESHTAERGLPAVTLLSLYEAALQIQEQYEAAQTSGTEMPGGVRHADFSKHPCILG